MINPILCAVIPGIDKQKYIKWHKKYLGRNPTDEEYEKWAAYIRQFEKDVKESGIESVKGLEQLKIILNKHKE